MPMSLLSLTLAADIGLEGRYWSSAVDSFAPLLWTWNSGILLSYSLVSGNVETSIQLSQKPIAVLPVANAIAVVFANELMILSRSMASKVSIPYVQGFVATCAVQSGSIWVAGVNQGGGAALRYSLISRRLSSFPSSAVCVGRASLKGRPTAVAAAGSGLAAISSSALTTVTASMVSTTVELEDVPEHVAVIGDTACVTFVHGTRVTLISKVSRASHALPSRCIALEASGLSFSALCGNTVFKVSRFACTQSATLARSLQCDIGCSVAALGGGRCVVLVAQGCAGCSSIRTSLQLFAEGREDVRRSALCAWERYVAVDGAQPVMPPLFDVSVCERFEGRDCSLCGREGSGFKPLSRRLLSEHGIFATLPCTPVLSGVSSPFTLGPQKTALGSVSDALAVQTPLDSVSATLLVPEDESARCMLRASPVLSVHDRWCQQLTKGATSPSALIEGDRVLALIVTVMAATPSIAKRVAAHDVDACNRDPCALCELSMSFGQLYRELSQGVTKRETFTEKCDNGLSLTLRYVKRAMAHAGHRCPIENLSGFAETTESTFSTLNCLLNAVEACESDLGIVDGLIGGVSFSDLLNSIAFDSESSFVLAVDSGTACPAYACDGIWRPSDSGALRLRAALSVTGAGSDRVLLSHFMDSHGRWWVTDGAFTHPSSPQLALACDSARKPILLSYSFDAAVAFSPVSESVWASWIPEEQVKALALSGAASRKILRTMPVHSSLPLRARARADITTLRPLALDGEFVLVRDKERDEFCLARLSIVDYDGNVVLDANCTVELPVVDHLSRFSGVHPEHLTPEGAVRALWSLKRVRRALQWLVEAGHCFVGHAIRGDFLVCGVSVDEGHLLDTAELYYDGTGKLASLSGLCDMHLQRSIQAGEHDSLEDAVAALELWQAA